MLKTFSSTMVGMTPDNYPSADLKKKWSRSLIVRSPLIAHCRSTGKRVTSGKRLSSSASHIARRRNRLRTSAGSKDPELRRTLR